MRCTLCDIECGSSLCASCQYILEISHETAYDKTHTAAINWRRSATIALLSELRAAPEIALLIQRAELSTRDPSPQEQDDLSLMSFHFENLTYPTPHPITLPDKSWRNAYDQGNATILCYTAASIFRDYAFQLQKIDDINGFFDGIYRYCLTKILGLTEFTESKHTSLFILQKAYIDVLHARGFQQEAIHHFRRLIGSIHAFRSEHALGYTFDFHGLGTRTTCYATIYAVIDLILHHPLDKSVRLVTGQHGDGAVKKGVAEACALLALPFSAEQDNGGAFIITKEALVSSFQRIHKGQRAVKIQIAAQAEQEALKEQEERTRDQFIHAESMSRTLLIEETEARQNIVMTKTVDMIEIAALFAAASTWKEQTHGALVIQRLIIAFHAQLKQDEEARLSLLDTAANAKIAFADQHLEDMNAEHTALNNTLQQIAYRNRGEQNAIFTSERRDRRALLSSEENTFETLLTLAALSHHSAAISGGMLAEKHQQLLLAHAAYRLILTATPPGRAIFEHQERNMVGRYFHTLFDHANKKKKANTPAEAKVELQTRGLSRHEELDIILQKKFVECVIGSIFCFLFQKLLEAGEKNDPDFKPNIFFRVSHFAAFMMALTAATHTLAIAISSLFIEEDEPTRNAAPSTTPILRR